MEQRKLIRLGNSSFAIALPKNWVERAGLKKGDNIFLEENSNGEINIWSKPQKTSDEKINEIDANKNNFSFIKKEIVSSYTGGSTMLILKGIQNKKELGKIRELLKNLVGFEIIESDREKIVIKDFFNIEETNIDNFLRRMDNNIEEAFNMIIESVKNGKTSKSLYQELEKIDLDTTKFYLLITRLFFRGINNPAIINSLKKSPLDFFKSWWFAHNLEHIGDQTKSIAKLLQESKMAPDEKKNVLEIFMKVASVYANSSSSFYKLDKEAAIKAALEGMEISKLCDKLSETKNLPLAKLAIVLKELEKNSYHTMKIMIYF